MTLLIELSQSSPKQFLNRRRCVLLTLSFVLGSVLIAAVAVGIFLAETGAANKASNPPNVQVPEEKREPLFEGSFDLKQSWDPMMANNHSSTFEDYATRVQWLIDTVFNRSSLRYSYVQCIVTQFSPSVRKPGETSVRFQLFLKDTSYESALELNVTYYFLTSLADLENSYAFISVPTIVNQIYADTVVFRPLVTSGPVTTKPETYIPDYIHCGEVRELPTLRIVGGSEAGQGVYPWMVMLLKNGAFECGGSILDPWHILTAAHCVSKEPKLNYYSANLVNTVINRLEIIAGKHETAANQYFDQEQRISVALGYMHNYNETVSSNDIAVLRLFRPLVFNSRVSNICLPKVSDVMPRRCVTAGWGRIFYDSYFLPQKLRSVSLYTYNKTECQRTFQWTFKVANKDISFYLQPGVICAANATYGGQDSCQGDSGGPLFCLQDEEAGQHYAQFGVVSWGDDCGKPGSPGFYTYTPYFIDWVQNIALPSLKTHASSTYVDDCLQHYLLTEWRYSECKTVLTRLRADVQCRDLEKARSCVQTVYKRYNLTCSQEDAYRAIINSTAMGLSQGQKQNCEALKSSALTGVCHNKTAISGALENCTRNKRCVSMLEVTLCIHRLLDPSWLHCTRRNIVNIVRDSFNESLTLCQDYSIRLREDGGVFVFLAGNWLSLCANHWSQNEAQVICSQSNYRNSVVSYVPWNNETIAVSDDITAIGSIEVTCSGVETSLANCHLNHKTYSLPYIAAAICYNSAYEFKLDPEEENSHYGYVRLTRDGGEGHVCVPDLSDQAADLLCRATGYVGGMTFSRPLLTTLSGPVWRTELACEEGALNISSCVTGNGWTFFQQPPDTCLPARVFCFTSQVRLHNGLFNSSGIVQLYRPALNGFGVTLVTVWRGGFDNFTAGLFCRQLGFPLGGQALSFNPFYPTSADFWQISCTGQENSLQSCNVLDVYHSGEPAVVRCTLPNQSKDQELSLKLWTDSRTVLIYTDGQWGTICSDNFTHSEATVICKQLGHSYGYRSVARQFTSFPHVVQTLRCDEQFTSIAQCSFLPVSTDQCQYMRPAAVFCTNQSSPQYSLDGMPDNNKGLVYVTYKGITAPLRANMSDPVISVLCQSLGFVTGERRNATSEPSGNSFWSGSFRSDCSEGTDIQFCQMQEPQLLSCSQGYYSPGSPCFQSTVTVYCYKAAARLSVNATSTAGFVQLYRQGRWWEICHDDITQPAADVICRDIMQSPSAAAIMLRDAYQYMSVDAVKAHSRCDSHDTHVTSVQCIEIDVTSKCDSFNNHGLAAVVCYDGIKPYGGITDWGITVEDRVVAERYGIWGTVCEDLWDSTQAVFLCRKLGYLSGSAATPLAPYFFMPRWVWSVNCRYFDFSFDTCSVNITEVNKGRCLTRLDATATCSLRGEIPY